LGNKPSIDISNPIDLFNNYADKTYLDMQEDILLENRGLHPPISDLSHSIFQHTVEDLGTSLQNTKDNESDSETMSDVVIFDPDAEPNTLDDYEYDFKNPLLHWASEGGRSLGHSGPMLGAARGGYGRDGGS
jgi:hypothetical protein